MSSILEALKKVEKEAPRLDFTPEVTKDVNTRRVVSRRARGSRALYRLIWSMVVVVVVCVGIWFAFSGKDLFFKNALQNPPAVDQIERPPVTASPESTSPAPIVQNQAEPGRLERPPVTASPESANPAPMTQSSLPVMAALEPSAPEPAVAKPLAPPFQGPSQGPEIHKPRPKRQAVRDLKPIREEHLHSSQPPLRQQPEYHPEDAKYKLEAIVWAESPENRFAVINGKIIRIGGTMDGLSIISIDRDHVAVRSSGREWNMKFVVD